VIPTGELFSQGMSPQGMVVLLLAAPADDLPLVEEAAVVKLSLRVLTRIIPDIESFLGRSAPHAGSDSDLVTVMTWQIDDCTEINGNTDDPNRSCPMVCQFLR
jgi:hypothetical protein